MYVHTRERDSRPGFDGVKIKLLLLLFIIMPDCILNQLNKLIFKFLWNNKPESYEMETLLNDYSKGGLNVVDIKSKLESFRIMQVIQLLKGTTSKWKYFAVYWIGLHLRRYVSTFASLTIPPSELFLRIVNWRCHTSASSRNYVQTLSRVTTKFIYSNIVETRTLVPRFISVHPTADFPHVWTWIQSKVAAF